MAFGENCYQLVLSGSSVVPQWYRAGLGSKSCRGAFQYQKISLPKISLPKISFGLVQSGWGESECFNKNLAPGSSEVFKDIFRAYRTPPPQVH